MGKTHRYTDSNIHKQSKLRLYISHEIFIRNIVIHSLLNNRVIAIVSTLGLVLTVSLITTTYSQETFAAAGGSSGAGTGSGTVGTAGSTGSRGTGTATAASVGGGGTGANATSGTSGKASSSGGGSSGGGY